MLWEKLGRIFKADNQRDWMCSHTAMPMPLYLKEDDYRIYFGTRNKDNQPHIGFVDININAPQKVLRISEEPALKPGPAGHFDDNGVYPATVVREHDKIRMYYDGRSNGVNSLFYVCIGLAESTDGGVRFSRVNPSPVMARSLYDPWMVTAPWVLRENRLWRMWYSSGFKVEVVGGEHRIKSYYDIKYAESDNGIDWKREGVVAIPLREKESNIIGAAVIKINGQYNMWYAFVRDGQHYQLGYARSQDGLKWLRKDAEAGITPSSDGWDSLSVVYPSVFVHKEYLYLLYCGNYFGKDGFGIARTAIKDFNNA